MEGVTYNAVVAFLAPYGVTPMSCAAIFLLYRINQTLSGFNTRISVLEARVGGTSAN